MFRFNFFSPDCNGILFLQWLYQKSAGEKDTVESGNKLLKILMILQHCLFNHNHPLRKR